MVGDRHRMAQTTHMNAKNRGNIESDDEATSIVALDMMVLLFCFRADRQSIFHETPLE
jgi:hypothetical protein